MIEALEVDVEEIDLGAWFSYQDSYLDPQTNEWVFNPPVSPSVRVRVRRMQPYIRERLHRRKKVSEYIYNSKSKAMERQTYFKDLTPEEEQREIDDLWDYVITGLEGFKNKKTGKIFECCREDKILLMKSPPFDRFIGHCFKILEGSEERQKGEAEKNLSNG